MADKKVSATFGGRPSEGLFHSPTAGLPSERFSVKQRSRLDDRPSRGKICPYRWPTGGQILPSTLAHHP